MDLLSSFVVYSTKPLDTISRKLSLESRACKVSHSPSHDEIQSLCFLKISIMHASMYNLHVTGISVFCMARILQLDRYTGSDGIILVLLSPVCTSRS